MNPHAADPLAVDFPRNNHGLIRARRRAEVEKKLVGLADFPAGNEEVLAGLHTPARAVPQPEHKNHIADDDEKVDPMQAEDGHAAPRYAGSKIL